jgi:acetyl-CoA carboxylase biotin carboxyl carrier protein
VADEPAGSANPFDVHTIEQLVELMSQHDLSEINLRQGSARISLRRGPRVKVAATALPAAAPAPAAAPQATVEKPAAPARLLLEIKAPMPGTFYNREKPEAAPYVSVGSRVTPTTVVGLIEAMKLFNEIQADCSGVIAEILVENAQPVEYNTVLFKVDPAG